MDNIIESRHKQINGKIAVIGLGATGSPIADMLYRKYADRFVLLSDSRHAERLSSGLLMPLQNGLFSYNYLREHLPDNIVLEGFVQGPNTRIYGNDIVYQNPGVYHLGKNFSGMKGYAKAVYEILRDAGVPCVLEDDIRHAIWCKLMINVAGNALTALTDLDYVMIRSSAEAQKICRTIMQEYKFVAATEDVLITEADISEAMNYFMTYSESKLTSMLEDVMNKRQTENEFIAGYIKRLAQKNGVNAPFIDMLYSIMRIKEDVYLGKLR